MIGLMSHCSRLKVPKTPTCTLSQSSCFPFRTFVTIIMKHTLNQYVMKSLLSFNFYQYYRTPGKETCSTLNYLITGHFFSTPYPIRDKIKLSDFYTLSQTKLPEYCSFKTLWYIVRL